MGCAKQFSITVVDAPAILFSWPPPTLSPDTGTADFTPDSADGNEAFSSATHPGGGFGLASATNDGVANWNSTAIVPANMHVVFSSTGTPPDPTLNWNVSVFVSAPAFSSLLFEGDFSSGLNGVVDFPFNLPNTGGANWTITWNQGCTVISNPNNAGSMVVTATLTLV